MALSNEKIGEIAVKVMTHKLLKDGAHVSPKGCKREVIDGAKALDVPVAEMAEFMKAGLSILFDETIKELNTLISKK